jgi:hypothetical protein
MFGQVFNKTNFRFERKKISLNLKDINETRHKKNGLFGQKIYVYECFILKWNLEVKQFHICWIFVK